MAVTYAAVLQFDSELKSKILDSLNILGDHDIKLPKTDTRWNKTEPQMILIVTSSKEKLEAVISECIPSQENFPITLSSLVTIPNEKKRLCLSPTPTLRLLKFHEKLYNALKYKGLEIDENYRPGSWIPCCQLVEFVPGDQLAKALTMSYELNLPLTGNVEGIGMVRLKPFYQEISLFPFCKSAPSPAGAEESFAVVLQFDDEFESKIKNLGRIFEHKDTTGFNWIKHDQPQIILMVTESPKIQQIIRKCIPFDKKKFSIEFSAPPVFLNDDLLSPDKTSTETLLYFHKNLCTAIKKEGLKINDKYRPDKWLPSCYLVDQQANFHNVRNERKLTLIGTVDRIAVLRLKPFLHEILSINFQEPEPGLLKMADGPGVVKFPKVEQLSPNCSGLTLTLKVVDIMEIRQKGHVRRRKMVCAAEALVGDETGMIVFKATKEQAALMTRGATVILRNAKIVMFKRSMRLAVDNVGDIEVVDPASFSVKQDNNMSLIEYDEVRKCE